MVDVEVLRVFCRGNLGGNLLGVVEQAQSLTGDQMQSIAAQLGFSETIFLLDPQSPSPRVRIFTPKIEMEFAGHPLVGAAWFLNVFRGHLLTELRCGLGPVRVEISGEESWIHTRLDQQVTAADPTFPQRAGMPRPRHSFSVAMPKEYILCEYGSAEEVARLAPSMEVLAERFLMEAFSRDNDQVRARVFVPAVGVPEDPATGSAAIALAALLHSQGESQGRLEIRQGEETGYPSTIRVHWEEADVAIGGRVVHDEVRRLGFG